VGDIVRTIDVGYTAFGRLKRKDVLVNDIQPGQVIVGMASYGQASYEDTYNGGMGSNGLTSARHDVFDKGYRQKYPESYDPATPQDVVYIGSKKVTDMLPVDQDEMMAGKLVLSPTRTYLPVIKRMLEEARPHIHGMIHNTGGGQTKVSKFAPQRHVIKDNMLPVPPLFQLIQQESGSTWKEMYQVFNMGQRLEVYVDEQAADTLIDIAQSFNIDAQVIGRVEEHSEAKVTIQSPYGTFEYS